MEDITDIVNTDADEKGQPHKSVDEVAMGFVRVANETMCRPIRALTQMRVSPLTTTPSSHTLITPGEPIYCLRVSAAFYAGR